MVSDNRFPVYGPVDVSRSHYARLKTLDFRDVFFNQGFWSKRIRVNHEKSLYYAYEMLEKAGNFNNMRIAAGLIDGSYQGYVFIDTDIYKWIEAAAWELGKTPDIRLQEMMEKAIELISITQMPCGYINSYVQSIKPFMPFTDLDNSHELYCAGHLFQAAVAMKRSLGDGRLVDIACRFADYIDETFGPDKKQANDGHPEIEMALLELYRVAGEERYLELAKFFIDSRGKNQMKGHRSYGPEYHQDHLPVRSALEAVGHSVRQLYLAAGVTDLYLEMGEEALIQTMKSLSKDVYGKKLYITGGMGARFDGEAFGDPFELPADQCYCETCAAIASFMWCWRMLLVTGESGFADQMERALYNNILACPALDGEHFFYINPLMLREARYLRLSSDLNSKEVSLPNGRPQWHDCACCPPNVMRLFSSLTHYLTTCNQEGIQIHHYAAVEIDTQIPDAGDAHIVMETEYPWQGTVRLSILESTSKSWKLALRIPGWNHGFDLMVNGKPVENVSMENGYVVLEQVWQAGDRITLDLNIEAELMVPHTRIDAIRGCLAIQRGPLVYCLEDIDQEFKGRLLDVEIDSDVPLDAKWQEDVLDGIVTIEAGGRFLDTTAWQNELYGALSYQHDSHFTPARLLAVPYYAWGNRGLDGMRVWIPRKSV